jgi:hypothetical protein
VPVDRPRHELLPRAALSGDQHGERVPRDRADELIELLHQRVLSHELVEVALALELRSEVDDLAIEGAPLEGAPDQGQDLVLVERLGQVVERPELHGGHRRADGLNGGHQDHFHVLVDRLDPLQDLDAVHAGEADIQEDQVHRRALDALDRLRSVLRLDELVLLLQDQPERLADPRVVVHDQDHRPHAPLQGGLDGGHRPHGRAAKAPGSGS